MDIDTQLACNGFKILLGSGYKNIKHIPNNNDITNQ